MKKHNFPKLLMLLKGDLFFLFKYGIFFVYAIFIAVYLIILHYLPGKSGDLVMRLLVFADPAAMGLFFMGAVILLEKSQRVNCSLAVSPVTGRAYLLSKSISFMLAGLLVGMIIAFGSGHSLSIFALIGLAGASFLFSTWGLLIATKARSLNQFIILSLPVEILISGPAFFFPFGKLTHPVWLLHPGQAAMRLLFLTGSAGTEALTAFNPAAPAGSGIIAALTPAYALLVEKLLPLLSLLIWNLILFFLAKKAVDKMFKSLGGAEL
ncbi:MAG: hypothetical protein K5930_02635 [Treponemataceae bacterium]|nr:hypothetical protein [Treponemataceae bacterium]